MKIDELKQYFDEASSKKGLSMLERQLKKDSKCVKTCQKLLVFCLTNNIRVSLKHELLKYPQSPLPFNFYSIVVADKIVFTMTRTVIPESETSAKAREFFEFVNSCILGV